MIRFSHTLFALPFALLSSVLAWEKPDSFRWLDLVGILGQSPPCATVSIMRSPAAFTYVRATIWR